MNNLELIKPLLTFDSEDIFYHLQIIKRKKEHPDLGANNVIINTYHVRSVEQLQKLMPEIILLCDFHDARAGINLNKKSFRQCAFQMIKKVTDIVLVEDYKAVRRAFESVAGAHSAAGHEKRWILDFDYIPTNPDWYIDIKGYLYGLAPVCEPKVIEFIPTKNGVHVITKPFNAQQFTVDYPDVEIHKNNPTLLYWKDGTTTS